MARTRSGFVPVVPAPPRTVPTVKDGAAAESRVRMERLARRPGAAPAARVRLAPTEVAVPPVLVATQV